MNTANQEELGSLNTTNTSISKAASAGASKPSVIKSIIKNYNIFLILIILIIISSIMSSSFLSGTNVANIFKQISALGVITMGMHMIILTGGIDLSVGSVLAMCNVIVAYFMVNQSMGVLPASLITILSGMGIGIIIGYLVAYQNMAAFVVTLAFTTIAKGFAYIISHGSPIMISSAPLNNLTRGTWLGIPICVAIMFIVFIIGDLIIRFTVFGRMIVAIGSNEQVVTLCGIRTKLYKMIVYFITGGLCGLAGVITASRTSCGSPLVGSGFELDAIAAVVMGGGSLTGGKGVVSNTLCGLLVLQIITNIMNLMNIATYPQQVIKGVIIIIAVLAQGDRFTDQKS